MLHMYQGDGKGKTTAAFGLALRELAYQKNVLIIQFLKNGTSGEMKAIAMFDHVTQYANERIEKFYFQMNDKEKEVFAQDQQQLWKHFKEEYTSYDYIVLDEILDVIQLGLLQDDEVVQVLKAASKQKEIVVTGRKGSNNLTELCDYHTEMLAHKHPYQQGVAARVGVEF